MSQPRWTQAAATLLSDVELIELVLAGERDLFQVLVRRYQESLFRVARALVQDEDVAADVVQDAFVRAYTNLARCHDRHRFRFWLLSTLRHRALDHLKEKRRRDASLSDDAVVRRVDAGAVTDSEIAERIALRRSLDTALERLSLPLRETFVLRHVEQWTIEEIAELLGIGESAVKMRLHRARLQLRAWLVADGLSRSGVPGSAAAGSEASVTERDDESSDE